MVDYPSRSPAFLYLLAGFLTIGENYFFGARLGIAVISTVVGGLVYLLTRELHSKEAGLAAAVVFLITPISLTWGLIVKTELSAQLFVLVGLIPIARYVGSDRLQFRHLFFCGIMFGLGFLSRKVVVAHLLAVGLFVLYYQVWERNLSLFSPIRLGVGLVFGFASTLIVSYAVLASFSPGSFIQLGTQHFIHLFMGDEMGLVWVDPPLSALSDGPTDSSGGYVRSLTETVYISVVFVLISLVAVLPLLVYPYVLIREFNAGMAKKFLTVTALGSIVAGVAMFLTLGGQTVDALAFIVILAFIALFSRIQIPDKDYFKSRHLLLPTLLIGGVVAGYVYRGDMAILYTLDYFPYVAVLSGVAIAGLVRNEDWRLGRNNVSIGSGLLVAAVICSMLTMNMFLPAHHFFNPDDQRPSPIDVENAGKNLAERTGEADSILTTYPVFALEADRQLTANLSRKMWILLIQPNSSAADEVRRDVLEEVHSGNVSYVIMNGRMRRVLDANPEINRTIQDRYCPVSEGSHYWTDNHFEYFLVRSNNAPNCQ
jgi:4-amino-4-deoxy-L-arabinose transferase-like glycosyltransferase